MTECPASASPSRARPLGRMVWDRTVHWTVRRVREHASPPPSPRPSGTGETLADATNDLRDDADALPPAAPVAYFDTLVGTDSHTPTANGIGVLGWGVGGIEAEAAALGQPITTLVPRVVGVRLVGELQEGVSAMDVALTFAQVLRERGVVGCFVECFGPGLKALGATQRTCISNMTPEYGCTCTLFRWTSRRLPIYV